MLANLPKFSSSSYPRSLPRRTDSLNAIPPPIAPKPDSTPQHPIFAAIDDDLRDARRVATHGQEEDLRTALGRVIVRVEELSALLRTAYRTTADLETSLGVAKSNLALVQSNNDMLEEALKRGDSSGSGQLSKDVGWRRWSAREGQQRESRIAEEDERPKSMDYNALSSKSFPLPSSSNPNKYPTQSPLPGSFPSTPSPSTSPLTSPAITPAIPTIPATPPASSQESRFFRGFRFAAGGSSSGTSTPVGRTSQSPARTNSAQGNTINGITSTRLNSPSMPSLVSGDPEADKEKEQREKELEKAREAEREKEKEREKRMEELSKELEKEKEARKKANHDKATLEAEVESLSQALFEEANNMVARERRKQAEMEDELREARMEKEALKSALRVIEGENGRLRRGSLIYPIAVSEKQSEERMVDEDPDDEKAAGTAEEEDGKELRPIDLDYKHAIGDQEQGRAAMEEMRDEAKSMNTETEAEAGPSASRSSSRMGMKSPVHSRRSSESTSKDLPVSVPVPAPTSTPAPIPSSSSPAESHTTPTYPLPLSLPQNRSPSTSPSVEEYATPMSRSQSQSLSQSYSQSDTDHDHVPDSHTNTRTRPVPILIPETENDGVEHQHEQEYHGEDEEEHKSRTADDSIALGPRI